MEGQTLSGVTTDIRGIPRPVGGSYDIGAYEYTDFYVDGNAGSDSNLGYEAGPWKTIQKAADTLKAGETVRVKGGITYSTSTCANVIVCPANSGTSTNYITYTTWPGTGIPIIDGISQTKYGFSINSKNYINISGFQFQNTIVGVLGMVAK